MANDDKNEKFWAVRDVPEATRRAIKEYAAKHGITVAEALEQIVGHGVPSDNQTEVPATNTPTSAASAGTIVSKKMQTNLEDQRFSRPSDFIRTRTKTEDEEIRTGLAALDNYDQMRMLMNGLLHRTYELGRKHGYEAGHKDGYERGLKDGAANPDSVERKPRKPE